MEWLSSKVVMAVAFAVVTASVLGYFAYQRSSNYEDDVERVAESLARWLEAFSTSTGEVRSNITFDDWGNCRVMPAIDGNPVTLNISRNAVMVTCGEYLVSEPHAVPSMHMWPPTNLSMNLSTMATLDLRHSWTGEVASPGQLVLERRLVSVSGEERLQTFCYCALDVSKCAAAS